MNQPKTPTTVPNEREVKEYAFSFNEEQFSDSGYKSIEAALAEAKAGDPEASRVWIGELSQPDLAKDGAEFMAEYSLYNMFESHEEDFGGEWWESDIADVEKESKASLAPYLEAAIRQWMADKNVALTAYNVVNVKEYDLESEVTA